MTTTTKLGSVSDESLKARTGRDWDAWLKTLDKEKANTLTHKEIAQLLESKYSVAPWWAQTVTVGYERARGMREVHETKQGFVASASKTINFAPEEIWPMLESTGRKKWLKLKAIDERSTPPKSVRLTLEDGSRVEIASYAKVTGKCSVTAQHSKLTSKEAVAEWKDFWKASLEKLKQVLDA